MTERPIIFSAEMIRAILDGRKNQTRRVVNRLGGQITEFGYSNTPRYDFHFRDRRMLWNDVSKPWVLDRCPYGQPSDLLWIKETWQTLSSYDELKPSDIDLNVPIKYLADLAVDAKDIYGRRMSPKFLDFRKNRPAIFMPKWAARIWLKVKDVRVERLQEITEEDAQAEGVYEWWREYAKGKTVFAQVFSGQELFKTLWDSINGKRPGCSWDDSPWVWVIEFERCTI